MARSLRHVFAVSLAVCLLILSGLVYPQAVAHAAHHAHHQAVTHSTALCAWLCAAGQALDAADIIFNSSPGPSASLSSSEPKKSLPILHAFIPSRGPPAPTAA